MVAIFFSIPPPARLVSYSSFPDTKVMGDLGVWADIAVLTEKDRVFVARHAARPFEPMTAALALIQGIWAVDPKMARKILRTRIIATEQSTPLAEGAIRVAAKRWNAGTP